MKNENYEVFSLFDLIDLSLAVGSVAAMFNVLKDPKNYSPYVFPILLLLALYSTTSLYLRNKTNYGIEENFLNKTLKLYNNIKNYLKR